MGIRAALIGLLVAATSSAQTPAAQTPAPAPSTQQARLLRCFAVAHTAGALVDVAARNLLLVANEAAQAVGPEQQGVLLGMLASGTLADQQPALDLTEQLELCVQEAAENAAPEPVAALLARAIATETQEAIDAAAGFSSDFERASPVLNAVLSAAGDPALQAAANGTYSRFGSAISERLHRVRLAVSGLIQRSSPQ